MSASPTERTLRRLLRRRALLDQRIAFHAEILAIEQRTDDLAAALDRQAAELARIETILAWTRQVKRQIEDQP